MKFRTRKMVAARDLNSNGTLFGGRALEWIDEEAFIFTSCQLRTESVVTRSMSAVSFLSSARQGEIVEIGTDAVAFGRTSLTLRCVMRNMRSKEVITEVERIVFVCVDENGRPVAHGIDHPLDRELPAPTEYAIGE
jgi:acyl-CoA thioesterase YciA